MKYLIVNADDFGLSPGVTRGILEAHAGGILASTSLMVDAPASEAGARGAREAPRMSVGLHADLPPALTDGGDDATARCGEELERQLRRFIELVGRSPTHMDSHHNVHRLPALEPAFVEVAARHGLPMREHSGARYFSKFYGQWSGKSHLEQVALESLVDMLEREVGEGLTELSCHPGYADIASGYSIQREAELRTLCDPRASQAIDRLGITLVSYHDYPHIAGR